MKIVPVWLTKQDGKVRDSHASLNRTPPGPDGTWNIDGVTVSYPSDAAASGSTYAVGSAVVNCRCVLIPTRASRV